MDELRKALSGMNERGSETPANDHDEDDKNRGGGKGGVRSVHTAVHEGGKHSVHALHHDGHVESSMHASKEEAHAKHGEHLGIHGGGEIRD